MKINQKLILGFLIVALLIGVVGYISVNISQKALQNAIGENSVLLAEESLDKIDRSIYNRIEEFQAYSRDLILQDAVVKSNQEFEKLGNIQEYIDKKDKEWISTPKEEITPFMQELINKYSEAYGFSPLTKLYHKSEVKKFFEKFREVEIKHYHYKNNFWQRRYMQGNWIIKAIK